MSQNRTTKTVSITLPIEIDAEIRQLAADGSRSFSNQVALLLRKQLAIQALELKNAIRSLEA
jgi:hypothetical protein